ncbi:hypothetical protein [Cupriavidus pauculus]|uniref:hypothetical protein n=1 Tax=Cupriavidus pauculus TaxID=82633 RepID=UPI001EE26F8B|nr:hypothetical protein [Cupriavidus pauculus]GJG97740.1 hypothetical protein CBA19C6_24645 [Cupriavidus pauculus]
MMKVIKVTFVSAHGDEVTSRGEYDRATGLILLSENFLELAKLVFGDLQQFEAFACESGRRYRLEKVTANTFRLRIRSGRRCNLIGEAWRAVSNPTQAQELQNGRYLHTISAAALVGAFGFVGSSSDWMLKDLTKVTGLFGVAVLLYVVGAIYHKGESE